MKRNKISALNVIWHLRPVHNESRENDKSLAQKFAKNLIIEHSTVNIIFLMFYIDGKVDFDSNFK